MLLETSKSNCVFQKLWSWSCIFVKILWTAEIFKSKIEFQRFSRLNFLSDFQPLELSVVAGFDPETFCPPWKKNFSNTNKINIKRFVKSGIFLRKSGIHRYFATSYPSISSYFCPPMCFCFGKISDKSSTRVVLTV